MKTIKGPAIFLAQFAGDAAPFNTLVGIARWAAGLGFKGVQIPSWDARLFDLERAADSKAYCDEVKGTCRKPASSSPSCRRICRASWSRCTPPTTTPSTALRRPRCAATRRHASNGRSNQLLLAAKASRNLGLTAHATFSGALAWPFIYPWPQRPAGLVETAFDELAQRWTPILDAFDEAGVDLCYEIHPGEDLHDGVTFEMFLERVNNHKRCNMLYDPSHFVLQQLDYLEYIDIYHERIKMFHVKDAEFNPTGRQGVYSGFQPWINRAGRFRSLGDGQVDFGAIFSKLTQYGFDGWAVLEWECCIKDSEQGAAEGAPFIAAHIIKVARRAFDDFAASGVDQAANRKLLGLS